MKCKLTNQDMTTHGGHQWTAGEWDETSGEGGLCGPGWLHYYDHPLLAVLLNPIHAGFDNPKCWEIEIGGEQKHDNGLKSGATRLRLVREIDLPEITDTQRVAFGILCAMEVSQDPAWTAWAEAWLSGKDRSTEAARAAEEAGWLAAQAAEWAAEEAGWLAAGAAAARSWVRSAERAVEAVEAAERAAGWAAEAAEVTPLDLITIAKKAMEY